MNNQQPKDKTSLHQPTSEKVFKFNDKEIYKSTALLFIFTLTYASAAAAGKPDSITAILLMAIGLLISAVRFIYVPRSPKTKTIIMPNNVMKIQHHFPKTDTYIHTYIDINELQSIKISETVSRFTYTRLCLEFPQSKKICIDFRENKTNKLISKSKGIHSTEIQNLIDFLKINF